MRKIEFKGNTYPCYVTMGAMVRFKRETGHDVSKMDGVADLVLFLWCCICAACNAEGIKFDISFESFADGLSLDAMEAIREGLTAEEDGDNQKKTEGQ